jgi:hypothetical protein
VQRLPKTKRSLGLLQNQEIKINYTIDSQGRQKRREKKIKIKSNVGPYEW